MLLPLLLTACAPQVPLKPDIVLVVVDTLRADHLGVYGYERPTSPRLDALAARGVVFERAYSQAPWTLASFASLLSGQYPHDHRVAEDRFRAAHYGRIEPEVTTLAEALSAAGYATAGFTNNIFLADEFGFGQGFDLYDNDMGTNTRIRSASDTVRLGLDWLGKQEKPVFLLLHFMEPHLSYDPPADLRGTFASKDKPLVEVPFLGKEYPRSGPPPAPEIQEYIKGLYDEEILGVDRAIGALADGLDTRGWERTRLVVTADHGEELWDHGGFEHGHTLYGELLRVPLIAVGAGLKPARVDAVVEHTDLFQGLLARGHATRPEQSEGVDLWGALEPDTWKGDGLALSECVLHGPDQASVVDKDNRLVIALGDAIMEAWKVAPDASAREQVSELDQDTVGRSLFRSLMGIRRSLEPVTARPGLGGVSATTRANLEALGYVEPAVGADESAP